MKFRASTSILSAGLTLLLLSTAQAASIFGTVSDGNGPIANATLTLSGDASATTSSDNSGEYSFPDLGVGNYRITLAVEGRTLTLPIRDASITDANVSLI